MVAFSLFAIVDQTLGTLKMMLVPIIWRSLFKSFPKRGIQLKSEIASKVYTVFGCLLPKSFKKVSWRRPGELVANSTIMSPLRLGEKQMPKWRGVRGQPRGGMLMSLWGTWFSGGWGRSGATCCERQIWKTHRWIWRDKGIWGIWEQV